MHRVEGREQVKAVARLLLFASGVGRAVRYLQRHEKDYGEEEENYPDFRLWFYWILLFVKFSSPFRPRVCRIKSQSLFIWKRPELWIGVGIVVDVVSWRKNLPTRRQVSVVLAALATLLLSSQRILLRLVSNRLKCLARLLGLPLLYAHYYSISLFNLILYILIYPIKQN